MNFRLTTLAPPAYLRPPGFVLRMAELFQVAAVAFGFAGLADLAAMVYDLVREIDPAALRNGPHQLLLNPLRCVAFGEAEPVRDA